MNAAAVRAVLERHGLRASQERGQHFLVGAGWPERLAERAGVEPGDTVLEIGTGLGALTRALAARAARVVTLEVDAGLVRALRAEGGLPANVELIHADALRADLAGLARAATPPVRLVANLPYSITGPALRRLLDLRAWLVDWSVMVQDEVAERLVATPGRRSYGSLAVLHAWIAPVERLLRLGPGCFQPPPKVGSTFLRAVPHPQPQLGADELEPLEAVVRAAFATRRKTLVNALSRGGREGVGGTATRGAAGEGAARGARVRAWLERQGLDPRLRAEALAPEQLLALARELAG